MTRHKPLQRSRRKIWLKNLKSRLEDLIWTVLKALAVAGALWAASQMLGIGKPQPATAYFIAPAAAAILLVWLLDWLHRQRHRLARAARAA